MYLNNNTLFKIAQEIRDAIAVDTDDEDWALDIADVIKQALNNDDLIYNLIIVFDRYGLSPYDPRVARLIVDIAYIAENQPEPEPEPATAAD